MKSTNEEHPQPHSNPCDASSIEAVIDAARQQRSNSAAECADENIRESIGNHMDQGIDNNVSKVSCPNIHSSDTTDIDTIHPASKTQPIVIPSFELTPSVYMSGAAKIALMERAFNPPELRELFEQEDVEILRSGMNRYLFEPMLERAQARYPVKITTTQLAGIPVSMIEPRIIRDDNRHRVLINLHGGFFTVGAGAGGLVESIPIAATMGITVISVDYRQGPEHCFPAASEDVAAVYRQLLRDYPAPNIGIYGASAGGMLTAMALAWFHKECLPTPGAVALLSAGATASMGGDSQIIGPLSMGEAPSMPVHFEVMPVPYLATARPDDPLVAPVLSLSTLSKFPPVLLLTGSRAFDLSATIHTQRCLRRANVDVDLQLWDGLWHCFFYDVTLPESTEAYMLLADFFDKKLGTEIRSNNP